MTVTFTRKTIIIVLGVIFAIVGGSIFWYSSQSNTKHDVAVVADSNSKVLGQNTQNLNIQEDKIEAPAIVVEDTKPATEEKVISQPAAPKGMSSNEVKSLFSTYYKRDATKDELNWWTGREYSELEAKLKASPIAQKNDQPVEALNKSANTNPKPTPSVDPAIKIELCKSEAETAKTVVQPSCTKELTDKFHADPNYATYTANINYANDKIAKCSTDYNNITDPTVRQSLIAQCNNTQNSFITSQNNWIKGIQSKYLDLVPTCTDMVYQSTYTTCLNK